MKKKPVICNYMTDKTQFIEPTKILKDGGVPCYTFPEAAAKALAAMVRYNDIKTRKQGEIKTFSDVNKSAADEIIQNAKTSNREILSAEDVYGILGAYGIPVAGWKVVSNADEAVSAAEELGYPVVIKADSASIVHKSDVGGVAVNLQDAATVKSTVETMQGKFQVDDLKFFIQKFMPGGTELIIGANADPSVGHLIMFGLGGVFVEIFKDVIFNISPLSDVDVREMITSIKGAPLIKGARGKEGVDETKLAETLQRVSQLVTDIPAIQEMDLNPILGYKDKLIAVDARIKI
jgi:acetyltransferase